MAQGDRIAQALIGAVDHRAKRHIRSSQLAIEVGTVKRTDILAIEAEVSGFEIEADDLLLADQYDPSVGDKVILFPLVTGDWFVMKVAQP